ncbi:MAG TPA: GNAT family N-acetyltransferase [Euzebyales bacterium]|nr:GNAT family N-acetyltransferase [Euzebyales bacterium]
MGQKRRTSGIDRRIAIVRRAGRSDVHDIATLWGRAGFTESIRGFRSEIARLRRRDPELLLIALREGVLVGAIAGSYDGRTATVSRLAVDPDVRRQGIARLLVQELCHQLEELGANSDEIMVVDDAPDIDEFWRAVGFERGRSPVYFIRRAD